MFVELISEIVPKNNSPFSILDDKYIRGSFRVVANLTERNSIPSDSRKYGMKVFVQSTDLVYELQSDLTSWIVDRASTNTLQSAYDGGNEIELSDKSVIIKNADNEIFKISPNNLVEFTQTLKGRDYTSSINVVAETNNVSVIDITNKTEYSAIHYFYTVKNSDNSGFETGSIYLIHDNDSASIIHLLNLSYKDPCGISFAVELLDNDLRLKAITDNSGLFSRRIHLFKVALI